MISEHRRDVSPLAGPAPYIGGKRILAGEVVKRIERIEHTTYCEPFVGMGGVFFRRRQAPASEVINDLSKDVAGFFRVLQRHYLPFIEMMRFQIATRAEFERLAKSDPSTLTDLERAARFYYLQRLSYAGNVRSRSFAVDTSRRSRFDITRLSSQLEEVHERLAGVVVECLPFDEFIRRYDKPGTLFYLDPPYFGNEADYGADLFERDDFDRLADQLQSIEGRFLLSLNDTDETRKIFKRFKIDAVPVTYTRAKGKAKKAAELIIAGPRRSRRS